MSDLTKVQIKALKYFYQTTSKNNPISCEGFIAATHLSKTELEMLVSEKYITHVSIKSVTTIFDTDNSFKEKVGEVYKYYITDKGIACMENVVSLFKKDIIRYAISITAIIISLMAFFK